MKAKFFLLISLLAFISIGAVFVVPTYAESVSSTVTVGNSAPSISAGPVENPESDTDAPTNVGSDVTFQVTATDQNSEAYYLIVCKTDEVTANNNSAPTCDSGTWCTSTSTASGNQAECSYTVTTSETNESYAWYAFVCDSNASAAACSSSSQGSGDSGSPFSVNHRPTFDTISNNGAQNPGQTVTWSTNASTTDADTAGSSDTVKLVVCKTEGVSGTDCDGGASDRWCQSSQVANNPSCDYAVPNPTADGSYDAYTYLFDSHGLAATGSNQGTNSSFSINNTDPVVSSVVVNGGSAIDLSEGTTQNVNVTATVTDTNGCDDTELPAANIIASLYRSDVGYSGCDASSENDYDSCYAIQSCSKGSCSNGAVAMTCTVAVNYHADPTDANSQYTAQDWQATVKATDDDAATDNSESSGITMNSLTAMDITASIAYGAMSIGTNSGNLDKTTTVTATGNVGLDTNVSGTDMCTDYPTCSADTIAVGQQKYGISAVAYSSATVLTTDATELELNCAKTISNTNPTPTVSQQTADIYWGIEIPNGTADGDYSGANTVTALKGETENW